MRAEPAEERREKQKKKRKPKSAQKTAGVFVLRGVSKWDIDPSWNERWDWKVVCDAETHTKLLTREARSCWKIDAILWITVRKRRPSRESIPGAAFHTEDFGSMSPGT